MNCKNRNGELHLMNQSNLRIGESIQKLQRSWIKVVAGLLLLLCLAPLPYAAAAPSPAVPSPMNLWPSAVSATFSSFTITTNSQGGTVLHLAAAVTFSGMKAPSKMDLGVQGSGTEGVHYIVAAGATVQYYRVALLVLKSDGTWYADWDMLGYANQIYSAPQTYSISAGVRHPDGTVSDGIPNGVYAVVIVYATVLTTKLSGPRWFQPHAWATIRVFVTSQGTPPA
jgi:hypothetical protein